jgi:hypothetical protein
MLLSWIIALLPVVMGATTTKKEPRYYYTQLYRLDVNKTGRTAIETKEDAFIAFKPAKPVKPELHSYIAPFRMQMWNTYGPLILRILTGENYMLFLSWVSGTSQIYDSVDEMSASAKTNLRKFIKTMRPADIRACQVNSCLHFLLELTRAGMLKSLNTGASGALNGVHVRYIVQEVRKEAAAGDKPAVVLKDLDNLPDGTVTLYAPLMTVDLADDLQHVSDTTLKKILQNDKVCERITAGALAKVIGSNAAKVMSTNCVKQLDLSTVDSEVLNIAPGKLVEYDNGLSEKLTRRLNRDRLKEYASSLNVLEHPGAGLDFTWLSDVTLGALPQRLFISRIYMSDGSTPLLGKGFKRVPATILADLSTEDAHMVLHRLNVEDVAQLQPKHVEEITKNYSRACDILQPANITNKLKINSTCFYHMKPIVQARTIVTGELPDDAFERVDANMVKEWYFKRGDREWKGFDVMIVKNHANAAALLKGLGKNPDGPNPCTLLGSFDSFRSNRVLVANIRTNCFLLSGIQIPASDWEDYKKLPARLKLLLPYRVLRERNKNDFFAKMTAETLGHLVTGGEFCTSVEEEIFNLIPTKALAGMDAECLQSLKNRAKLTNEQVGAMPELVFQTIPAKSIPEALFTKMTPEQLEHAATKALDDNNIGIRLTAQMVGEMCPMQIGALTEEQWKTIPPEAHAGINTNAKLASIKPEITANWTLEHVENIPEEILSTISFAQVAMIGSAVPAEQSPLRHLVKLDISDLLTRRKLLKRFRKLTMKDNRFTWMHWTVLAILIMILIGLPVVFFLVQRYLKEKSDRLSSL